MSSSTKPRDGPPGAMQSAAQSAARNASWGQSSQPGRNSGHSTARRSIKAAVALVHGLLFLPLFFIPCSPLNCLPAENCVFWRPSQAGRAWSQKLSMKNPKSKEPKKSPTRAEPGAARRRALSVDLHSTGADKSRSPHRKSRHGRNHACDIYDHSYSSPPPSPWAWSLSCYSFVIGCHWTAPRPRTHLGNFVIGEPSHPIRTGSVCLGVSSEDRVHCHRVSVPGQITWRSARSGAPHSCGWRPEVRRPFSSPALQLGAPGALGLQLTRQVCDSAC